MNDRYLRILIKLESKGIDIEDNITDLMYSMFKDQPDLPYDKKKYIESTPEEYITRMVGTLHGNRHLTIECKADPDDKNKVVAKGRITYLGLEYLNQYRLTQSSLDLNNRLKKNLRNQIIIGILTLSAIAITAFFDGKKYYNKEDSTSLKRLDTLLLLRVKQSDKSLQLQKERNMHLRIMANEDSIKVLIKKK